jgi:proline racemase
VLSADQPFNHEGIIGTTLQGRVRDRRPATAERPAVIVPIIEATAWPIGRSEFQIDRRDAVEPFEIG